MILDSRSVGFAVGRYDGSYVSFGGAPGAGWISFDVRGVRYVCIRTTEGLAEAGIGPLVGSVGDSYDDAWAESVIGRCKTGVIRRRCPSRGLKAIEFATLEWGDCSTIVAGSER